MTNKQQEYIKLTAEQLIAQGILTYDDFSSLIEKKLRADKRAVAKTRRLEVKSKVLETVESLLKEAGATVQHRTVWNVVGREEYTRDEVLNALRSLRTDGVLQNIRTSGNNFQVYWALVQQPKSAGFEVNGN